MSAPSPFGKRSIAPPAFSWKNGSSSSSSSTAAPLSASASVSSAPPSATETSNKHQDARNSFLGEFHKRAVELERERQLLASTQQDCDTFRAALNDRREHLKLHTRVAYLTASRKCHGVELEWIQLQKQQKDCKRELETIQQEETELEQEIVDMKAQWEVEELAMNQQTVKQELYQRLVQDKIKLYHESLEKREKKLHLLKTKAENMMKEKFWKEQQMRSVLEETKRLEAREQEKNDQIQQIGSQVRSLLTQVGVVMGAIWLQCSLLIGPN